MKNTVKKYIGVMLILVITILFFSSCADNSAPHVHIFKQKMNETEHFKECRCGKIESTEEHTFDWRSDYKHKECTACGYIIEYGSLIVIEKNDDGTIKLKNELVTALSNYFKNYNAEYNLISLSFADKLDRCKNDFDPLLVKFSDKCYYVAAYYTASHENAEHEANLFCCYKNYAWVGFEKAEDIKESWDGKKLIGAFQINPGELCVNIKTGANDVIMEHFAFYRPEFVDGVALAPEIAFDDFFIYLNEVKTDKYIAYSSTNPTLHEINSLRCIEIEGKYYVMQHHSTDWNGSRDLKKEYGEYYDELMRILVCEHAIQENNKTNNYGLFKIENILKIMNSK